MTGFGRGEATDNGSTATVELKSLNSRYLDISIRLPQRLQDKELQLKELIQKVVNRGKISVTVHLNGHESEEPQITVDEAKVKAYTNILNKVRDIAGILDPLTLRNLTNFGDIFITQEEDEELLSKKWALVEKATIIAVENLMVMRSQEGSQLKSDLSERISGIDKILDEIIEISAGRIPEVRNKLKERIKTLVDDDALDADRLEIEVAIQADKMDVTEETVRLRAHLKFFIEAIEQPEPAGRRLNFLTQEINRELNTIGSKANDSAIAHLVVKAKEMLEQIREQVQNIE